MSAPAPQGGRVLVVEDDFEFAESLGEVLTAAGHAVHVCDDGSVAAKMAGQEIFDAVLTDFRLPGTGGMGVLESFRSARSKPPVILMTAHSHADLAIEATKRGAFDFLVKPFDLDELLSVVERAVQAGRITAGRVRLGEEEGEHAATGAAPMLGASRIMQGVFKDIGRFAPLPSTVLVLGETGTGKELVARALWQHSRRADRPFIAVNCGALPQGLLESELFGHARGAFTGAVTSRVGRFEQADGGTLFLDEIGDLPMELQVKLLRVLQDGTVQPLGSSRDIKVDVRVIAATNQPLERLIAGHRFREDLFYRLNAAVLRLPPLRERGEDIPLLARHFVRQASGEMGLRDTGLSPDVLRELQRQPWPGNVRQLQHVIRLAVIHAAGYPLTVDLIQKALANPEGEAGNISPETGDRPDSLAQWIDTALEQPIQEGAGRAHGHLVEQLEKKLIARALQRSGGHLSKVASWLGISRVTLRKKMADLGL